MFNNNFGIEIEFTGITRAQAARIAAEHFGTTTYGESAKDNRGRTWDFKFDGSITCQRRQNGRRISAGSNYSVELVSPILKYRDDIETLQELVRKLRAAGGFTNRRCGIHIHLNGSNHTARSIRNFVNIIASKNDLFYKALQIDPARMQYCKKMDEYMVRRMNETKPRTLDQIKNIWYSGSPSLEITKVDADTGARLAGATFRVAVRGSKDYTDITSGPDGVARLTGLEPTYLTIKEIVSPEGYLLSDEEHTVEIVAGQVMHITLTNHKKPALEILKIDSITKQPLQYATFRISYKNGAALGNFTTDIDGRIVLEGLEPQLVVIEEVSAPDGYIVSGGPQEMLLKPGETHTVTFENVPKSPIIIKKIDSVTGEPLAGAKFRVTKMNGELIGEFTSGRYGYVTIPEQQPGWFTVVEILSPAGYKLNGAPINVEIKLNGDPAIVEFENTPLPGLLIRKVDAATGLGMAGVEFEIEKLNGERIGTFMSDEGGHIFIEGLSEKHILIREVATLPGYKIDTAEKLVELKEGELNTVVFENWPWPYLVIQKLDEDKAPLAGAVFKISALDGKEIGTYTTNEKGRIVLTGLDAQTVLVQEIQAPEGYALDNRVWEVELKWGMTTTITLKNAPLKIEVEVEKRGPVEAIAGQEIRYNFRNIANFSTVPLDDFYWYDILPTDALRLTEIYTGTWNEDLTYKVVYRTKTGVWV